MRSASRLVLLIAFDHRHWAAALQPGHGFHQQGGLAEPGLDTRFKASVLCLKMLTNVGRHMVVAGQDVVFGVAAPGVQSRTGRLGMVFGRLAAADGAHGEPDTNGGINPCTITDSWFPRRRAIPYSGGAPTVINVTLFDWRPLHEIVQTVQTSGQLRCWRGSSLRILIGQPWMGVSLCTVAAFFGLSALHRVGGRHRALVLQGAHSTLEQRKRMFQEMA